MVLVPAMTLLLHWFYGRPATHRRQEWLLVGLDADAVIERTRRAVRLIVVRTSHDRRMAPAGRR